MATHSIVAEELLKTSKKLAIKSKSSVRVADNSGKFQGMMLGNHKALKIEIEEFKLESVIKLLVLINDYILTIETHISHRNTHKGF